MKRIILLDLLLILFCCGCAVIGLQRPHYDYGDMNWATRRVHKAAEDFAWRCMRRGEPFRMSPWLRIDSVDVDKRQREIEVYFNRVLGEIPFRDREVDQVYRQMRRDLPFWFRRYDLDIYCKNARVAALIPNYYRADYSQYDTTRMPRDDRRPPPVVRNISSPWKPTRGLRGRNIALWHSHGWYYENALHRWEWQRARVYQVVEDLFPMAYTIPYLIPMLEKAGATVFVPRERDIQTHEVIIDYDSSATIGGYREISRNDSVRFTSGPDSTGFAIGQPPYGSGVNPFRLGSYRCIRTNSVATARVEYVPDFPEGGRYGVQIAYTALDSGITDARYIVYHSGGKTEYLVNQQIGGGTWLYLGTFRFKAGQNPDMGKVVVTNQSRTPDGYLTFDAVRFGGGMGNISRNGLISNRPRYAEAARYYLQYAGMPDTLVYNQNGDSSDYKDDYQCRGEWVNYLKGAPFGPQRNRQAPGLGIPVDLSLAFHTDAGQTRNDIVIGTLLIYNTEGVDSSYRFPDGVSRLASRDLADILQTQIVEDIRATYDPLWNRRALWDRGYSEAYRPNVPAALLELLSHHNFLDMKFGHDPRFRFDASRSIYKALLRFIATQYQTDYVVQPLPVTHFAAVLVDSASVRLSWKPQPDPLEPSAVPTNYIVYTRIEDNGFDSGILVDQPQHIISGLEDSVVYSFKVTAVNEGGESFPSEILAVCTFDTERDPVLVVNGFDRVAAPATIKTAEYEGFMNMWDQGVPDRYELAFVGQQYDLRAVSPWRDDDAPGHGASWANYECNIIAGNTFDFPVVHGWALLANGYPFVSLSDEAVMDRMIELQDYQIVDIIMGEEKLTRGPKPYLGPEFAVFPSELQQVLTSYCQGGGALFISGAYVGTDPFVYAQDDSASIRFAGNILKYRWRTNYAVRTGHVHAVSDTFLTYGTTFEFNTELSSDMYAAESPDAIEPADSTAETLLRYTENNTSAAVGYQGHDYRVAVFGFPFETIRGSADRALVMQAVINYLTKKRE